MVKCSNNKKHNNCSKLIMKMCSLRLVFFNISKISEVMKVSPGVAVALWRRVVSGKEEISSPFHEHEFLTCEDCVGLYFFQNRFHLSQVQNFLTLGSHLFEHFLGKLWPRTAAEIVRTFYYQ